MSFIFKLLNGELNFIIPISYIIIGTLAALIIFTMRYVVYKKRKKFYAQLNASVGSKEYSRKEVKQLD